jgi:hypothetical protein
MQMDSDRFDEDLRPIHPMLTCMCMLPVVIAGVLVVAAIIKVVVTVIHGVANE